MRRYDASCRMRKVEHLEMKLLLCCIAAELLWTATAFSVVTSATRSLLSLRLHSTNDERCEQGLFPLEKSRDDLDEQVYDLVVVGSGNGACGFLSHYLEHPSQKDARVIVLERGENFFFTSDITHQNGWTESYSQGNIFKLHDTHDKKRRPILSGGACTMGGGGSINYTMIHEASSWLVKHLGFDLEYWDDLKKSLNKRFERPDPIQDVTPITRHILKVAESQGFSSPISCSRIENIPNQNDNEPLQLYQFPTQFNTFGQRTNSGVSIVSWEDSRLRLETGAHVERLEFGEGKRCTSVKVRFLDTDETKEVLLSDIGKVIICAGAASPRILMNQEELSDNQEIGKYVSDHFAMPLGIYVKPNGISLSPKDIYGPIFATMQYQPDDPSKELVIVSVDFFTGKLQKMLYLTSHLFLAFLLPNCVKNFIWTRPKLFALTKTVVRTIVTLLNVVITWIDSDLEYITAIIKYNPAVEGEYETTNNGITLGWFESNQDKDVANKILKEQVLPLLEGMGGKPGSPIRFLYRLFTRVPYETSQIKAYVDHFSQNSMLSEQHLAGGCLIGKAAEAEGKQTGLVKGSDNVYVADLSAVPLPRVSPQMTAYLIGYHVANQLYPSKKI